MFTSTASVGPVPKAKKRRKTWEMESMLAWIAS